MTFSIRLSLPVALAYNIHPNTTRFYLTTNEQFSIHSKSLELLQCSPALKWTADPFLSPPFFSAMYLGLLMESILPQPWMPPDDGSGLRDGTMDLKVELKFLSSSFVFFLWSGMVRKWNWTTPYNWIDFGGGGGSKKTKGMLWVVWESGFGFGFFFFWVWEVRVVKGRVGEKLAVTENE